MAQYIKTILYYTKANIIDLENIHNFILYDHLLQKYSDFWLNSVNNNDDFNDFIEFGIVNEFSKYMYKAERTIVIQ
uniref:Uncharacterized protein n=1 Tax=Rhizophagus irregularis (strain DAOM 181602 / DAOM 197198 / MUCL 43194) TaxID=747089 RepID=U9TQP3_RHIID